jgi:hypothetical protein
MIITHRLLRLPIMVSERVSVTGMPYVFEKMLQLLYSMIKHNALLTRLGSFLLSDVMVPFTHCRTEPSIAVVGVRLRNLPLSHSRHTTHTHTHITQLTRTSTHTHTHTHTSHITHAQVHTHTHHTRTSTHTNCFFKRQGFLFYKHI